jgi:hypothetical protein
MDDKPWFQAKSFGYGAGIPITCKGWVLLIALIATILLGKYLADAYLTGELRQVAIIAAIVVPLAVAIPGMRKKTDGAWRWRSGRE